MTTLRWNTKMLSWKKGVLAFSPKPKVKPCFAPWVPEAELEKQAIATLKGRLSRLHEIRCSAVQCFQHMSLHLHSLIAARYPVITIRNVVHALPTSVSVAAGKVTVTSAVAAGPIRVTEFVPLSVSSLNNIEPAAEDEPVNIGAVKLLFVNV